MSPETYDYSQNPYIDEFKTFIRDQGEIHPWIIKREQEAAQILGEIPTIPIPEIADPRLLPQPADQKLVLTPFDKFDGMHVAIPPEEHLEGWRILHEYNLRLANHPARIHAMKELESRGFQPSQNLEGVIDMEESKKRLLQLSDLGHAIDMTNGLVEKDKLMDLSKKIRTLREAGPETIANSRQLQAMKEEVEVFVQKVQSQTQAHRTELLATGPFTLMRGMAFSYIGVGAMPDITGSVLFGVTAAKMGIPFGVPEVGQFSDPKKQAALMEAILSQLTVNDPLLEGYSNEDKKYIVNHWRSCPIGVTEVDPYKALKRADYLAAVGCRSFRLYGHTRGGNVVATTSALRREYPKAIIIASQISGIDVALACEYVGADIEVLGVSSGGRCTTGLLSNFIPTNAGLSWALRGRLGIPLFGEGGAVDEPVTAALTGFSGVNGSGSIGGGTFEPPGGLFFLTKDGIIFWKPYGGEASDRFKYLSNRMFGTGVPYIPEGEQTFKELEPLYESMTQRVIYHWTRVVLGAVVLGVDAGPYTISAIQKFDPSPLWQKTRTTSFLQNTH